MALFTAIGLALGASAATAAATGALVVGATAMAGSAIYAATKKPKAPAMPTTAEGKPVTAETIQAEAAEKAEAVAVERQRAEERFETVHTSPLGLEEEAVVAKKKLVQRARSQTVYTSPFGLEEEAELARKTLLGR